MLSNTAKPESVDVASLHFYKKVIEEKYGNIENYLKTEMKLSENDLATLAEKYTVSAP